ncbi:MAG: hypothetical protein WBS24_13230 [Terriglobales bacterium]
MKRRTKLMCALTLCAGALTVAAQDPSPQRRSVVTVKGRVEVAGRADGERTKTRRTKDSSTTPAGAIPPTVVWLTPAPGSDLRLDPPAGVTNARLVQKNKKFEPHLLVVPAGSTVEFPNRDPFFHNVFSLFEGKRFDLGLYEAGTSRTVRFDRPGISYIFCNIHPEMSAVIITMSTPLYATANSDGQVSIVNVAYGRYMLHIWSESMGPENDKPMTREITIGENAASLGVIQIPELNGRRIAHKNKYGRDYDEPTPDNGVYQQH